MALLASERHLPGDVEHWRSLEACDRIVARGRELRDAEGTALAALAALYEAGPAQVSVSWGKDSVVVAHLAVRLGVGPLAWYPAGEIENPDCASVRDAFLAAHPGVEYLEVPAVLGDADWDRLEGHDGAQEAFVRVSRAVCRRYASGVRAEESEQRRRAVERHGLVSSGSARPIGDWSSALVFAYLSKYDLPVHPAYACTMAGVLDRGLVRVGTIGGVGGACFGRRQWEATYYPELLHAVGALTR